MATNKTKKNNNAKKAANNEKKKAEQRKKIQNKMKANVAGAKKIPPAIYELPEITEARKRLRKKFTKNIQNGLTRKNNKK